MSSSAPMLSPASPFCTSPTGCFPKTGRESLALLDQLFQRESVVVLFIARRVKQRHRFAMKAGAQIVQRGGGGLFLKLLGVGGGEFAPFRRIVVKAATQIVARRDVLQPKIDARMVLGNSARPEAVDKHAKPVAVLGRLIDEIGRASVG